MRIDAHQHYWTIARGDYGWLTPELGAIHRDVGPADLAPHLARHGISRTILVQAAPTEAETRHLLDLARVTPSVAAVVGWSDLTSSDAADRIRALSADTLLVGLRPMLHDVVDEDFVLDPRLGRAFRAMVERGLVFDALVRPRHLPRILVLAARYPDLPIVVDHAGKPEIAAQRFDPWRADMAALAQRPNVVVKLSGLATEARAGWTTADLAPVADHLLAIFGPDRMMWGSDWPVLEMNGDYDGWCAATDALLGRLSQSERDAVLGGTAEHVYLGRRGRRAC